VSASTSEPTEAASPEIRFRAALDNLLAGRTAARMHFQPIVDMRRGTIAGYEALVRFPSPPSFPPDYWFRSAGMRGKRIVMEHLAATLALENLSLLPPNTFLSVNVGPAYLLSKEFLALTASVKTLDRVVIEITEGDQIDDYPAVRQRLDRVRELGGSIAVDDTGSGYASLRHVMELRPQFVKLDRFFIQGCHDEPAKAEMIHMIGEAADRLDAWVIAEGIETAGELNEVLRRDVPLGQGYLLGRPQEGMALAASPEALRIIQLRQRGPAGSGLWHLLEHAQLFTSVAEAEAAVRASGRSFNAAVLDEHDRPQQLVEFHPVLGVRAMPSPMRVAVSSGVNDVLRRAISRPVALRFDPLAVTGELGEFLGVLRIDHLMNNLLTQLASTLK
jgi:EAL domain-containing protein (putative c-di-GMP-specific phosphodiesterase class I)